MLLFDDLKEKMARKPGKKQFFTHSKLNRVRVTKKYHYASLASCAVILISIKNCTPILVY